MPSSIANGIASDRITSNWKKGRKTFIIPLTFPDLSAGTGVLERIGYGGDVWELRVDLLGSKIPLKSSNLPSLEYVGRQLDILQKCSDLPILFTIRTIPQGGKFPEDAVAEALHLMLLAVEKGCSYIDVEMTWPRALIDEICEEKKDARIIASFHDWTGDIRWSDPLLLEKYRQVHAFGDILKLSILATTIEDCHELALFVRNHRTQSSKPILAVGMGAQGQLSRITSPISLVTHPLIPFPSAPGQLSLAQVHQASHLMGQLPKRNFFIFGNNISHSLSPTIHNAAFRELGLPHHYSIHQTPNIDDSVQDIIQAPSFGGASITYPHKLEVRPLLQSFSESARKINAVNTIIVQEDKTGHRCLVGDNTDWQGLVKCILRSKVTAPRRAIVIGAGGAARAAVFALQKLNVSQITVVNRTKATAQRLAADLQDIQKIDVHETLDSVLPADIIIGCIPADDVTVSDIPLRIFAAERPGLVIEMSYRPPVSALMHVASRMDDWEVMNGLDVLKEQAYVQFELWTGCRAPVCVIEEALARR